MHICMRKYFSEKYDELHMLGALGLCDWKNKHREGEAEREGETENRREREKEKERKFIEMLALSASNK